MSTARTDRRTLGGRSRHGGPFEWSFERLEGRTLLAVAGSSFLDPIALASPSASTVVEVIPGSPIFYEVDLAAILGPGSADAGRLIASLVPVGFEARLSLLGPGGAILIQSDGRSAADPDPLIDEHLAADSGPVYLEVESLGGPGRATFSTTLTASTDPFATPPQAAPASPFLAVGDFRGDGQVDYVGADGVHLNLGGGLFGPAVPGTAPSVDFPADVAVGRFDGGPDDDLAAVNSSDQSAISILLSDGDGTFRPAPAAGQPQLASSDEITAIAVGDFLGDGRLDLAAAYFDTSTSSNGIAIFASKGDGTFQGPLTLQMPAGESVEGIATGHFDQTGRDGLAVVLASATFGNWYVETCSVVGGQGSPTLNASAQTSIQDDGDPTALAVGDFDGEGLDGLAVAEQGMGPLSGQVVILSPGVDGTLEESQPPIEIGYASYSIAAGDFDGTGRVELAVGTDDLLPGPGHIAILARPDGGTFALASSFPVPEEPFALAAAEFTGDGRSDLATANFIDGGVEILIDAGGGAFAAEPEPASATIAAGQFQAAGPPDYVAPDGVHLNLGDGSFAPGPVGPPPLADGDAPSAIVAGAFGAGPLDDVAVADFSASSVVILEGVGGGSLRANQAISLGDLYPSAIAEGDFFGDGRPDLAVAASGPGPLEGAVVLLENEGDGRFAVAGSLAIAGDPRAIAAGPFADDGRPDLAVAAAGSAPGTGTILILADDGGGRFHLSRSIPIGTEPTAMTTADFNGDGLADLAVVGESGTEQAAILLGEPDGSFRESSISLGSLNLPSAIVAGDFDGSGKVDLAVAQQSTNVVSILVGNGDGTFSEDSSIPLAATPTGLATADFNGDGLPDLAVSAAGQVEVDFGNGDDTFRSADDPLPVGQMPSDVASGDFTGDGRVDLAVLDPFSNQVKILLGNGDGSFRAGDVVPVGDYPIGIVAGDFTGDGRVDLAVADQVSGDVRILLGDGEGDFRLSETIDLGSGVQAIAEGQFAPNGPIDLAVINLDKGTVTILLNRGDGEFSAGQTIPVGVNPEAIAVGDFNGDGLPDLAVADYTSNDVEILAGDGDGTFRTPVVTAIGGITGPDVLAAGDFFGDGKDDGLAVGTATGLLEILKGNPDGTTSVFATESDGAIASALAAGDFSGIGRDQLAVADDYGNDVAVYTILPDGTFSAPTILLGDLPGTEGPLVAADFNGDGLPDLAEAKSEPGSLGVALNEGGGTFAAAGAAGSGSPNPPLLADATGDGVVDETIVGPDGEVLVRPGVAARPGVFLSPILGNPDPLQPDSDVASRGVAVVGTDSGPLLASLDRQGVAISLFRDEGVRFVEVGTLAAPPLASQILSADLDRSGEDDLIVVNPADGTIWIYWNDGKGGFDGLPTVLSTAVDRAGAPIADPGVSQVGVADLGDGLLDLIATDAASGAVIVLSNEGGRRFGPPTTYRAGSGPGEVGGVAGNSGIASLDQPDGAVAAVPGPGGRPELVVNDPGSDSLAVLSPLGDGRYSNPASIALGGTARQIVAVHFGGSLYGLAALVGSKLLIFVASGDDPGGFAGPPETIDLAGLELDGLTAASVLDPGLDDLLIGDAFGDVQLLIGDGRGGFTQPETGGVALAVDASGIYLADPSRNLVLQVGAVGPVPPVGTASEGLDRPDSLATADLNGDGLPDLIVANAGANELVVYLPNPAGGPPTVRTFPTGTDPTGITVADLNGDGILDVVVADRGSNDVTVLIGQGRGADWTLIPAGRYPVGDGPTATAVVLDGDNVPDILVSDAESDDVRILRGIGDSGTFLDDPDGIRVGVDPGPIFVFNDPTRTSELDLLTVNAGSNDLSLVRDIDGDPTSLPDVSSMGLEPSSALVLGLDGQIEILVANQGDGFLSLFRIAAEGLEPIGSVPPLPDLPNPAALAGDGQGDIFAANAGDDSVLKLGVLGLIDLELGLGSSGGAGSDLPPATGPLSLTLRELGENSLPAIPDVESTPTGTTEEIALSANSTVETIPNLGDALVGAVDEASATGSGSPGALPNQPILDGRPDLGPVVFDESDPEGGPAPAPPFSATPPSARGIIAGIDQAFASARDRAGRGTFESWPTTDRLGRRGGEALRDWGAIIDAMAGKVPGRVARLIEIGLGAGGWSAVAPGPPDDRASPALDGGTDAPDSAPTDSSTSGDEPGAASAALVLIAHVPALDQRSMSKREGTSSGASSRRKP